MRIPPFPLLRMKQYYNVWILYICSCGVLTLHRSLSSQNCSNASRDSAVTVSSLPRPSSFLEWKLPRISNTAVNITIVIKYLIPSNSDLYLMKAINWTNVRKGPKETGNEAKTQVIYRHMYSCYSDGPWAH